MLRRPTIVLLTVALIATGCTKQQTVESRLENVGTWNIATLEWMKVTEAVTTDSSELEALEIGITTGTIHNAGSYTFKEGGTGTFDYQLDSGFDRTGNFLWSTDEDGVTGITEVSINVLDWVWNLINNPDGDFTFNQEAFAYTLTHNGGDSFTMEGGGAIQVISAGSSVHVGQYAYTITAELEKP